MGVCTRGSRRAGLRTLVLFWLLGALAPVWLGPSFARLAAAYAESNHVCACGMAVGTCGCPECDRLERQRLTERTPDAHPVLKGECERRPAALSGVTIPAAVLPAPSAVALSATASLAPSLPPDRLASRPASPPPTPPPRGSATLV